MLATIFTTWTIVIPEGTAWMLPVLVLLAGAVIVKFVLRLIPLA